MVKLEGTAGRAKTAAPSAVIAVGPEDTVLRALELLAEHNIGAVVVLQGGRLVGIVSERDYARSVELKGRAANGTRVSEIMTREVVTVARSTPIAECSALMHRHRIRHLPLVENGRVVGMLSSRDVLEAVIAEEEKQIRSLETERLMIETGSY